MLCTMYMAVSWHSTRYGNLVCTPDPVQSELSTSLRIWHTLLPIHIHRPPCSTGGVTSSTAQLSPASPRPQIISWFVPDASQAAPLSPILPWTTLQPLRQPLQHPRTHHAEASTVSTRYQQVRPHDVCHCFASPHAFTSSPPGASVCQSMPATGPLAPPSRKSAACSPACPRRSAAAPRRRVL